MKKGCLITLVVLIVLVVAVLGGGYVFVNNTLTNYGYYPAEMVSHETLTADNTRIKAVVKSEYVRDYLVGLLPPELETQLPSYFPWSLEEAVNEVLPYEVALLAGADYAKDAIDVTVFVNEKRGGPFLAELINKEGLLRNLTFMQWNEMGIEVPERGVVKGLGEVPIPENVVGAVSEAFAPKQGKSEARISGDNLAEVLIDNTDGDAAAVVGVIVNALGPEGMNGATPEQVLSSQEFKFILQAIEDALLTANITGEDEITFDLRIATTEDTGLLHRMMIMGGINDVVYKQLKKLCADNNMKFDFKPGKQPNWDADGVLAGSFVLSGFRDRIEQQIRQAIPQQG